jgi:hypothetical protein
MPEITLTQLEEQHATSDRRRVLLVKFKEELAEWRGYLADLNVWLFGSFLTDKQEPGDIDVLLAGRLKPGAPLPPKLPRKHRDEVHVISNLGTGALATKEQLVQKFNEQEGNVEKGIQLTPDAVTDLRLGPA